MIGFGLALQEVDLARDYQVAERKRLKAIWGAILQRCNNPKCRQCSLEKRRARAKENF